MYSKSTTPFELIQKLPDTNDVKVGTEQGHPMSPELFKLYIYELSEKLEELDYNLLWADDLILLALDAETLQRHWTA